MPSKNGLAQSQSAGFLDGQPQQKIEWLTAKEAAEHLRIKTHTLLLWTRQGKINGYALSGGQRHVWRYLRAELDAAVLGSTASLRFRGPCS